MGDHQTVSVDRLITSDILKSLEQSEVSESSSNSCGHVAESSYLVEQRDGEEGGLPDEEQPLLQAVECRICQEEDTMKNLEVPCACSGSLKYAHRKCVQKWCNEKGDIICEICHRPYQPGYTAPSPCAEDTAVDISHEWAVSGAQLGLNDPQLLAMAAAERHLLEAEYEEYTDTNANGAAFCRSAALILMALLLLRHVLYVSNPDGDDDDDDDDISTFFSFFLLRAAGFLIPCYIMAWAISILQRRRQRQEPAALAPGEVAYVIQAGQNRGLHFTVAPGPAVTAHHRESI